MDNINSNLSSPQFDIAAANENQFFLNVKGVPDNVLTVLDFDCDNNSLSLDYQYNIYVMVESKVNPVDIIGKSAKFDMLWDADSVYVHGLCTSVFESGAIFNGEEFTIQLSSPMSVLKNNQKNRVFLNKDISMIIDEILLEAGFQAADYKLKLSATYPVYEYLIQYNETDFDFLSRQLSHHGIYFRFEQTESKVKIIFHDNVNDLPMLNGPNELMFQERSGQVRSVETVSSIRQQADLMSEEILLKDYNYRTPESDLTISSKSKSEIKSIGLVYRYGLHYKTIDQGEYFSNVYQQSLEWQRKTFVADTDCRGLVPGIKFTLTDHPVSDLNGDYLVIEVEASGSQRHSITSDDSVKKKTYHNKVLLIKAGIEYRSKIHQKSMIYGSFSTKIETTGGDYAYLDDQGRYRVRLPFDVSDKEEGDASHAVRLMQLSSGSNYGMHFPLHAGTEVVMSCVNGDINRPLLLGMVSNPDTPSTVTSANVSQNILRTWAGNELLMEDRKSNERIDLFTKDKNNILTLSAKKDGHHIRLATEKGEMEIYADKTLLIETGDSHTIQSGNDHLVEIENDQQLVTKNKEIEQQAATDIIFTADKNILLEAEAKDVNLTTGKDIVTTVDANYSLEVKQENVEMLIPSGEFSVNAGASITFAGKGGGPIHIGQASGKIEISNAGDLLLDGPNINIKSSSINIKAGSIGGN
ncbi:MAG: type VI secretion system Vgr family protein [Gammaproteobacteria bacterium]